MKTSRIFALLALSAAALAGLSPVAAASAGPDTTHPVIHCGDLVRGFDLPGARTHVTAANVVAATATDPEYCGVQGYVEPAVRFDLRLPTQTYAGRYLQYGCGGFCGGITPPVFADCGLPHGGDVAVAATDDGHVGKTPFVMDDGRWAEHDQAARDDFAFRAPHVVSRAAKRIIQAFYGAPPKKSYFSGCSNGGREGLLLAQRYPHDFDGIVAGAPAAPFAALAGVYQTWLARSNTGADGKPILTAAKLPALHEAVLAACDRLDGLADGQLDDPRACHFDPAVLTCPAGTDAPSCLTPAQVTATRKLYSTPSDGVLLYPGSELPGSEAAWAPWTTPSPELGDFTLARALSDNYLRYVGYPIGAPASSTDTFAFTRAEFDRLTPEAIKGNALNPDLSAFRRAGGKLIIWHGWADQAIPPAGTLDYFQRMTQRTGGAKDWTRLFMVPSVFHCGGGTSLTDFDPLQALVGWVERGAAPDRVVATGRDSAGKVTRTRPVFPYPLQARYNGTGSIDDAANFHPAVVSGPPHDVIHWAGDGQYIAGPVAK